MRKKTWLKWVVAVSVGLALVGASVLWYISPGGPARDVVATVNGDEITEEDLNEHLKQMYGQEALETLIVHRLILNAAEKANIAPSQDAIEEEISGMKEQMGGEEGFAHFLSQYGMNEEALRHNLLLSKSLDEIRYSKVDVEEADLQSFFEENKSWFDAPERVRASHILLGSEERARDILEELDQGADFAELAKQHSLDTASGNQGGDLDFFARGTMYQEFEDAAFALDVNEISEPVETDAGFHIIKVTDREDAEEAVYEEVRSEVEAAYKEEHAPSRDEIIHSLQAEASVQVHWTGLGGF